MTLKSYFVKKYFPEKLYDVLLFLNSNGQKTELTQLKQKFKHQISKPLLHSILSDLERHNYIEVIQMKDRRKKIVSITDFGMILQKDLEQIFNRIK